MSKPEPAPRRVRIVVPKSHFHGREGIVRGTKLINGQAMVDVELTGRGSCGTLTFAPHELEEIRDQHRDSAEGMQKLIETTKARKAAN